MSEQANVAMVVIAHPDDAEFDGAGTVARWVSEGWRVVYVICTDGTGGGPDNATDVGPAARRRLAERRQAEQREACRLLGVQEVVFLNYLDGQLQPSIELRRDLVRQIRRFRPRRVICQSPERVWTPALILPRYHPDHLAAGQAVLAAAYPAAQNPWDFPELLDEGLQPHQVEEIFITIAPTLNHAVDVSKTIETKFAALRAHASQFPDGPTEVERMLREIAREAGQRHGVAYAEEFHRVVNE